MRSGKAGCGGSDVTCNLNIHDGGSARDNTVLPVYTMTVTDHFLVFFADSLVFCA